jgi:hypothetical protein
MPPHKQLALRDSFFIINVTTLEAVKQKIDGSSLFIQFKFKKILLALSDCDRYYGQDLILWFTF